MFVGLFVRWESNGPKMSSLIIVLEKWQSNTVLKLCELEINSMTVKKLKKYF
jgi:hypothetical protein